MTTFLQISFSGLATGAIFAVAAVGFALLWQTAGAINFAHGEFIVLPAVVMLVLGERRPTLGLPDWVPVVGGTAIGGPLPEMGIVLAFVLTIPLAVFFLGYLFKFALVAPLASPSRPTTWVCWR
jgi:branched-chain amino acid transport system permease protein